MYFELYEIFRRVECRNNATEIKDLVLKEMRQLRQSVTADIRDMKSEFKKGFDELNLYVTDVQKQMNELRNSKEHLKPNRHNAQENQLQESCFILRI